MRRTHGRHRRAWRRAAVVALLLLPGGTALRYYMQYTRGLEQDDRTARISSLLTAAAHVAEECDDPVAAALLLSQAGALIPVRPSEQDVKLRAEIRKAEAAIRGTPSNPRAPLERLTDVQPRPAADDLDVVYDPVTDRTTARSRTRPTSAFSCIGDKPGGRHWLQLAARHTGRRPDSGDGSVLLAITHLSHTPPGRGRDIGTAAGKNTEYLTACHATELRILADDIEITCACEAFSGNITLDSRPIRGIASCRSYMRFVLSQTDLLYVLAAGRVTVKIVAQNTVLSEFTLSDDDRGVLATLDAYLACEQ